MRNAASKLLEKKRTHSCLQEKKITRNTNLITLKKVEFQHAKIKYQQGRKSR